MSTKPNTLGFSLMWINQFSIAQTKVLGFSQENLNRQLSHYNDWFLMREF
jgi:hypothetical protein